MVDTANIRFIQAVTIFFQSQCVRSNLLMRKPENTKYVLEMMFPFSETWPFLLMNFQKFIIIQIFEGFGGAFL